MLFLMHKNKTHFILKIYKDIHLLPTSVSLQGANPYQRGVQFPNFPAPPTRRPPVKSPPPCVWAVIQCCPSNQRLVTCFESLGCPGVNWDSNPCRDSVSQAARAQVEKFYRETEDEEERYWKETRKCRFHRYF